MCPALPFSGHFRDERPAMDEKTLVAFTEIVQATFSIWCPEEPVFRASAVTHISDHTFPAKARQGIQFSLAECFLGRTLDHLDQGGLDDVPKTMVFINKVIAWIEVAVVFNDWNIPAARPKNT